MSAHARKRTTARNQSPMILARCSRSFGQVFGKLKHAAAMCEAFHRASSYHYPLIAKFAAYRAQAQMSDLVSLHH
jgi:hypothetical protein